MFFFILKRSLTSICSTTQKLSEVNLMGRDCIGPKNLSPTEIKSLLWTALELKCLAKQRTLDVTAVENARLTLILDKSSLNVQLPLTNAARILKTSVATVMDTEWKDNLYLEDYGRLFAASSDILFCNVQEQCKIEQVSDGCNVPVIAIKTSDFSLVRTLSDMLTMYLYFGYLKNLTVGYVGLAGSLINTYMCMLPLLGMNIKYCCVKDDHCTQHLMSLEGLKFSQRYNTEIHECCSASQTIYRTDVLASSKHDNSDYRICLKDMQEAAIKWGLLYELPRGECDIDNEVFKHQYNLTWQSMENCTWIYAALILRFLTDYNHVTLEPCFERKDC